MCSFKAAGTLRMVTNGGRRMASRTPFLVGLIGLLALLLSPRLALFAEEDADTPEPKPVSKPACILIWLDGGPPTIDMWDLKHDTIQGEPFRSIATAGNMKICEHLPKIAQVMDKLSIIRSMTSRMEVDGRARQYMHTCYVPHPFRDHPSVGAVIARELSSKRPDLTLPAFILLNGTSLGSGYLDHRYTPLAVVDSRELLRQTNLALTEQVLERPMSLLDAIDGEFNLNRGRITKAYRESKQQTLALVASKQLEAFNVDDEDPALRAKYGANDFGQELLVARRLVERGVPFVEVTLPGWDIRQDYLNVLRGNLLPTLDSGLSTLVRDLDSRGLLEGTVIVVTSGFGRARADSKGARQHWSRCWSLVVGGGGLKGGIVIGQTNPNGTSLETEAHRPPDLWATVARALDIPLDTIYLSRSGRPMRIFNSGKPIEALLSR
jgi:hypothetical protein